jgi:dTDP-glucose pyrophosphorylase
MGLADGESGLVVVKEDHLDAVRRNFAVIVNKEDHILKLIEKPIAPQTCLKGCGLYVLTPDIFDAIRITPGAGPQNEIGITDSIQTLVDLGFRLRATRSIDWDVNVTSPGDLLMCNLRYLRERNMQNCIGPQARIAPEVRMRSTIVGNFADIAGPSEFVECLIFSETKVANMGDRLQRCIVAPGTVWACQPALA